MDFKEVAKGIGKGVVSVGKGAHDAVERYGNWVQETNKRLEEERNAAEGKVVESDGTKKGAPAVKSLETIPVAQKEMICEAVDYKCEKCRKQFKNKPHYLEIHQMEVGGDAEPENLLVVCSFCHRDLDTIDDPSSQVKYLDNRTVSTNKKIGIILQSLEFAAQEKSKVDRKQNTFGTGGSIGGFGSKPIDLGGDCVKDYMEKAYLFGKKEEPAAPVVKESELDKGNEKKPVQNSRKAPAKNTSKTTQQKKPVPQKKPQSKVVRGSPKDLVGHKLTKPQLNVVREKGHVYIQHNGKNVKILVENVNTRTGEIKK